MRRFVAERPGVEVHLTESTSDQELLDQLERGETDLTFTVLPLPGGPFEAVELMRDPYRVLAAVGSPLALAGRPPTLAELGEVPLIGSRHCFSGEQTERLIQGRGVDLNVVFRSDDNGTVQGLVGTGMAAALMPALAVEPNDDQVVVLATAEELPPRRIALAWHRHRALSRAAARRSSSARSSSAPASTSRRRIRRALVPSRPDDDASDRRAPRGSTA